MGVNIKDLIVKKDISIKELEGKVLAVDGMNILYQFLTTIRQRDGAPLTDSKGNITSHLVGLFSRTTKLMEKGIKLIFVFDGEPPKIKLEERERRRRAKEEAKAKYEAARVEEDVEGMRKYAGRTAILTKTMVEESKRLLGVLGLPIIQAPSEGEAQAAQVVKSGRAFACVSQDYDSLLFGAPKIVRSLSVDGKRKMPGKSYYVSVKPEIISLADTLNDLGIDQEQLIVLAILIGTDYNPGGVKGIGPKTALKLVKKYKDDFDWLFEEVKWKDNQKIDWKEILYTIKQMPVVEEYDLVWRSVDREGVKSLLCGVHDFDEDRVEDRLKKLAGKRSDKDQKGLKEWF